jgi:dipeptidyl aminopeptidase/acylaminoacyl peptidase
MPASSRRGSVSASSTPRRVPRPDDLYRMAIPFDARLAPDGRHVTFSVQRVGPSFDAYRQSIWIAPTEGSGSGLGAARQLTLGAHRDWQARWSADGRWLTFVSDRRSLVEEEPGVAADREDVVQVHRLPMDAPGEARRLTDLPRGVEGYQPSPDGRWLAVRSASHAADRKVDARLRHRLGEAKPGEPPTSDYRFFDRLGYLDNAEGFIAHRTSHLWLVEVATGAARRLTDLPAGVNAIAWSPDSSRIAVTTGPRREWDLFSRSRVLVVDVATGKLAEVASHPDGVYGSPAWLPDGRTIAVLGGLVPTAFYRNDVWLFPADGSDPRGGRDLSARHDIMPGSTMNSDVATGESARLVPTDDGRSILFLAPYRGAIELWRLGVADGALERLTEGRHYLSGFDAVTLPDGRLRVVATRSSATSTPDVHVGELAGSSLRLRAVTALNRGLLDEVELREPVERWVDVDGRRVQGWLVPAVRAGAGSRGRPSPAVLEIHGGPHTLFGWSPMWEFQVLAAAGMSVVYSNPRGSEGYGLEFNMANRGDWGDGPMRDVLAVLDAFVAAGLVDPDRLGVTGGSYGGYLTNWIIGHDQRFKAAFTARSVADMAMLMLTGDLSGTDWPEWEFGPYPAQDPELWRRISPLTYAANIRTPLLIQHSERDLRTTVGQAEALFATLRRLRRPVRLMRVPDETHELTRSGTPYRRVENLVQVRDWFSHFLVAGRTGLPPKPATRHGR